MSLMVPSQDHYVIDTVYAPSRFAFGRDRIGTRCAFLLVRTLANADSASDIDAANKLQDAIKVEQRVVGAFLVGGGNSVAPIGSFPER